MDGSCKRRKTGAEGLIWRKMMMKFKNQDGGCIVDGLIKTIQDNKDF